MNFNCPRPQLTHPSVYFDLVEIKKLVDEAAETALNGATGRGPSHRSSVTVFGEPLSEARILKMQEQAIQKLSRAYKIDEIATAACIGEPSPSLKTVASEVLKVQPDNLDARYVHFFHETIDLSTLANSCAVEPLNYIITKSPRDPALWRTRAFAKAVKMDIVGAIEDITKALPMLGCQGSQHQAASGPSGPSQNTTAYGNSTLQEDGRPSGLASQLYFYRASYNVSLACQYLADSLPADSKRQENADHEPQLEEKRKHVKTYAKTAIRDFLMFFSFFTYSPKQYHQYDSQPGSSADTTSNSPDSAAFSILDPLYPISELFDAAPPSDLPPTGNGKIAEILTSHPLLLESLHRFLISHALAQTSTKELSRHAEMVARLTRVDKGSPISPRVRPAAYTEWIEILNLTNNWIKLAQPWEELCARPINDPLSSSSKRPPEEGIENSTCTQSSASAPGCFASGVYRASLVARWILEVPSITSTAKRKTTKKSKTTAESSAASSAAS